VFRSTELSRLSATDARRLVGLGIRTVYDLRSEPERRHQPEADRLPPGVAYVVADVAGATAGAGPMRMLALLEAPESGPGAFADGELEAVFASRFRQFVTEPTARDAYGRLFAGLADPTRVPAVFHCTTGKDRTGWGAAALQAFLGVPDDVVAADFLASTELVRPLMAPIVARFVAAGGDEAQLAPLVGVLREYLDSAFEEVRRAYGSIEGYVADGLGLDAAARDRVRATLLEPAGDGPETGEGPATGDGATVGR
jgi:protein-tyrosine phosphatase